MTHERLRGQPSHDNSTHRIHDQLLAFGVPTDNIDYAAGLFARFHEGRIPQLHIGENFWPSALMTPEARASQLGVVDFAIEVNGRPEYLQAAASTTLIAHQLDAGLGTSVVRDSYLAKVWERTGRLGEPHIGAKGTDLYFEKELPVQVDRGVEMRKVLLSIMEIKYLHLLKKLSGYKGVVVRPVVNEDSAPAIQDFLNSVYLWDRLDMREDARKRTYREVFESQGNAIIEPVIVQPKLPTIDAQTGELTTEYTATGSHGQVGSIVLHETEEAQHNGPVVRALYNGDGVNNMVPTEAVGFVVAENAGACMISTTKMGIDVKGGQLGIELVESENETVAVPQMLELAQATDMGQRNLFIATGLENQDLPQELAALHERGQQYFNTNVVLINETLVGRFLAAVREEVGDDVLAEAVSPDLIRNPKKQNGKEYIQLEGALGSVLLNLNRFILTNETARRVWREVSGGSTFLRFINADPAHRDIVFTPNKTASDFWLQAETDQYQLDTDEWVLKNATPGRLPTLGGDLVLSASDNYYADVEHMIDSFGKASVIELDELTVVGKVCVPDATMKGTVTIVNEYEGKEPVDLTRFLGPKPTLANVNIHVEKEGNFSIKQVAA